ncbi:MAG: vWA domain-containing protein [Bacteroidota bacterium]
MKKQLLRLFAFIPFLLAVGFAAKVFLDQYQKTPAPDPQPIVSSPTGSATIQVALLLDISGSMDGLIEQAKTQLWQIVNELGEAKYQSEVPSLEIALYVYGGDHLDPSEGYVQQLTPLTTDLDLISEKLFELSTNGGEEYCGKAIEKALLELNWSQRSHDLRMIFIAGNEPFSQGPVLYRQACEQAGIRDVVVNTIFCGDFQEGIETQWKDGADLGKGQYMNIDHNQELAILETPFDAEIVDLNSQLNSTYIAYGTRGAALKQNQIQQDQNARSYGLSNLTTRSVSKSKKVYTNQHWDLVDAAKNKKFELEEVQGSELLGDSLAQLSKKELSSLIEEKSQQRELLQVKILELDQQRKAFIKAQRSNETKEEGLDQALIKAIRKQAEKKAYQFEK